MLINIMTNNVLSQYLFQPVSKKLMLDLATHELRNDKKTEKNRLN
jgi:hypothetical protein